MKTFLIITIFITALLHSCASYENKIIGQWVEKNNYKAPRILEFTKDYYTKPHNQNDLITFPYYRQAQYLYKVREDTLFQCSDIDVFIVKQKITLTDDELIIQSGDSDSLYDNYLRNTHKNYIDFINNQLDLSIQLPKGSFYVLNWTYNSNSFFIDKDERNNIKYLLNGNPVSIDSNLHAKLFSNHDYRSQIICFADSNVLVKDLNPLKVECSKARYPRIYFCLLDSNYQLSMVPLSTPFVKFTVADTSNNLPPPPIEDISFFKDRYFILCEVRSNKLLVNGTEQTYETFIQLLKDRAFKRGGVHLLLNYDERLSLQEYVSFAIKLSESFNLIQSSYIKFKFNKSTYWDLNDEEKEKYNNFIIFFNEILKNDLEELYNYLPK